MLALCVVFGLPAEASEGNINIRVNEAETFAFTYVKVADYRNGEYVLLDNYKNADVNLNELKKGKDFKKAVEVLSQYVDKTSCVTTENQEAFIKGLSEGAYLIQGVEKEGYEIPSTIVSVPNWDEENEQLSYQITVVPKIQKEIRSVQTGDGNQTLLLSVLCLISVAVVVGVSYSAYFLKDK